MNNFQKLMRHVKKRSEEKPRVKKGRGMRHAKRKTGFWAAVWGNRSVGARIAIVSSLVLVLAVIVTAVWMFVWFDQNYNYDPQFSGMTEEELGVVVDKDFPEGITNIALFGIDSRSDNFKGLSDSIMILSVNGDTGSIKLVSIMRDSLVRIDGYGYQKINAAYSLGGPQLAVKTLNQTFELNIMDYATVDFVGMAEIVDAVGGIEAELTKYELKDANASISEMANKRGTPRDYIQSPGKQTLTGIQAVAFSRIRKVQTVNGTRDDYGRTERQRLVMHQLFEKALNLELTEYPALIKAMLPYVETSLDYNEIFKLAKILKVDNISMQQGRIPADNTVISSGLSVKNIGSCVYYDLEYAAKLLDSFLFKDIPFEEYMETNGIEYKKWFTGQLNTSSPASTDTSSQATSSSDGGTVTDTEENKTSSGGKTTDKNTNPSTDKTADKNTNSSTDKTTDKNTDKSSGKGSGNSGNSDTTDTGTATNTSEDTDVSHPTDEPDTSDESDRSDPPAVSSSKNSNSETSNNSDDE